MPYISAEYVFTKKRKDNRYTFESFEVISGGTVRRESSQYAALSRAEDLAGLPPAYTYGGELDLFRDETIDYLTRLLQAGAPAEFRVYPGCFHACGLLLT
jgi:acetyl esterase/lipase